MAPVDLAGWECRGGIFTSTTDPRGKVTSFAYDTRDRVTQVTYPDDDGNPVNNPKVSLAYDSASNVTSRTNERNYTTTFTHDALGRVTSVTDPLNHTTSYLFDAAGNLTRVTNALAQATNYAYNNMNRLTSVTDALGNVTAVTYDSDGNITGLTDPLNRTISATYNALGQQTATSTPLANTTTYTRDAEGQTTAVADPLTNTSTAAYSSRGWTTTTTDPLNNTVSRGYDSSGNMTTQSHYGGGQNLQYDNRNAMTRFTNEVNASTNMAYDIGGNRTSVTDPLGHADTFTYDARNRPTSVTNAINNTVSYAFDPVGNLTGVTDPLNRAAAFAYDAADRLTSITLPDPDGAGPLGLPVTAFGYDNADRLTSLTDPVNNQTSWSLDAAGRVTGETNPLGSRSYVYNGASELVRATDRIGRVREFVYDSDGRRTQEKWFDANNNVIRTISYGYDAAGRLTSVSDPDFSYAFTYDADDRLVTINNAGTPNVPQVTLTNTYDGDDNRTNLADSLGGSVAFGFDGARRVTSAAMTVSGQAGPQVTFGYDAANRVTLISRRAGSLDKTDTSLVYDNADRLTSISHAFVPSAGGSTAIASYSFGYNAANELTSQTNSDGTLSYSYDATGQLTAVTGSFPESYSYDLNGNRTMTGYSTGTANRLLSDGTFNYAYDAEGNLVTRTRISDGERTEFTWDYCNRLTQVIRCTPGGGGVCSGGTVLMQASYVYDVFNRRIGSIVDTDGAGPAVATGRWTVYDAPGLGANPLIDFIDPDGSGPQPASLDSRRLSADAIDTVLARYTAGGAVSWLLTDHLGSVRDVTNNTATVVDHINYDSYGRILSESNPSAGDRFKYTGHEHDSETGLYHAPARSYDPATGRFISPDPINFAAGDVNLYRYVSNAPTIRIDPLGLTQQYPGMPPDFDYGAYMQGFAAASMNSGGYTPPTKAASTQGSWMDDVLGFVWNDLLNTAAAGVLEAFDLAVSVVAQIVDGATEPLVPGNYYEFPNYYWFDGMLLVEGGLWDYGPQAFTLGQIVFGQVGYVNNQAILDHEVYGHGDQDQYGPFYGPLAVLTYVGQYGINGITGSGWGASAWHEAVQHNWFEDQANSYMMDYLANGYPHVTPLPLGQVLSEIAEGMLSDGPGPPSNYPSLPGY